MIGAVICLLIGAIAGLINGVVVVYGRIQPIIATLATGAIYIGVALFLRPQPGGKVNDDLNWALTNSLGDFASTVHIFNDGAAPWFAPFAGIPTPFVLLALIVLLVWVPFSRTVTGRTVYAIGSAEGAAYMSGLDVNRARIAAFTLGGFFAACGGLFLAIQTSSGNADIPAGRRLHPEFDRRGGDRRHLSVRRQRRRDRLGVRRPDPAGDLLLLPHLRHRAAAAAAVRGDHPARRGQHRRAARAAGEEHAGALSVTAFPAILKPSRDDRPILIAALFIVAILIVGTAYTWHRFGSAPLLSPNYLLQQLQIGAFLGVVAAGQMVVILIAQIDLSVPWTLTAAAMMATAVGGPWAIPIGLAVGLVVGLVNGLGVAYLRVPSMIFTLGVNAVMRGLMVAHTGGFAPDTAATDLMRTLAVRTRPWAFPTRSSSGSRSRRSSPSCCSARCSAARSTRSATRSRPPISPASTPRASP